MYYDQLSVISVNVVWNKINKLKIQEEWDFTIVLQTALHKKGTENFKIVRMMKDRKRIRKYPYL